MKHYTQCRTGDTKKERSHYKMQVIKICDDCLTAASDDLNDVGMGNDNNLEMQRDICLTLGSEIPDHICEDEHCQCGCKGNRNG